MTADIANVLATLAEMGERTASKLLSFAYVPATGPAAEALGVGAPEKLQRSVRVRSSDGTPFSYLVAHVPGSIGVAYSRQELAAKPLLALLERAGVKIERASQRISAVLATPETAAALKVKVGSPLVELVRVVYDSNGRGVEHLHALYRPDRYNLEMDLERSSDGGARNWTPAVQGKHRRTARRTLDTSRGTNSKCQTIN
jgi:GntR family transcriptional regulator